MQAVSDAPAEVAAVALELGAGRIYDIEPIKHGLTNRSWLVSTDSDRFVVRISDVGAAEELQIDRNSEALVLQHVARAGIGPQILRCDPAAGILVTRYLGATWTEQDTQSDYNIGRLAGVLRRLHSLDIPAGVRAVDLAATVNGYIRTLLERGTHSRLALPALRDCADETASQLRQDSTPRLCHNDVHHLNIVGSDPVRLIDWEYAGVGEPLFDLAAVCVYHRYRKPQRERLLMAYGEPSSAINWQRLELACWLFDYIRDLWTAVR
ncbi:MAG TPA: choline/ethanolamine kinase family protein [Steroidobacteraceae bacterium]|nr:choline/ethanolamine kinase family protein [Steroidobacteraceae bacterium]